MGPTRLATLCLLHCLLLTALLPTRDAAAVTEVVGEIIFPYCCGTGPCLPGRCSALACWGGPIFRPPTLPPAASAHRPARPPTAPAPPGRPLNSCTLSPAPAARGAVCPFSGMTFAAPLPCPQMRLASSDCTVKAAWKGQTARAA